PPSVRVGPARPPAAGGPDAPTRVRPLVPRTAQRVAGSPAKGRPATPASARPPEAAVGRHATQPPLSRPDGPLPGELRRHVLGARGLGAGGGLSSPSPPLATAVVRNGAGDPPCAGLSGAQFLRGGFGPLEGRSFAGELDRNAAGRPVARAVGGGLSRRTRLPDDAGLHLERPGHAVAAVRSRGGRGGNGPPVRGRRCPSGEGVSRGCLTPLALGGQPLDPRLGAAEVGPARGSGARVPGGRGRVRAAGGGLPRPAGLPTAPGGGNVRHRRVLPGEPGLRGRPGSLPRNPGPQRAPRR